MDRSSPSPSLHAQTTFTNWAHIHSCTPTHVHYPSSAQEVADIVRSVDPTRGEYVRVWGAGHSPSDIACSDSHLIVMHRNMNRVLRVVREEQEVSGHAVVEVEGGMTLQQLNEELPKHGLALSNLGSVSEQTVAGAIATGTHGTGWSFGILATTVLELELVLADGRIVRCSRQTDEELFLAALCGLGSMGIITKVTMQCVADYSLRSHQFAMPFDDVLTNLDALNPLPSADDSTQTGQGDRFRFWWFPHTDNCLIWRANNVPSDTRPTSSEQSAMRKWLHHIRDYWIGYHLLEFLLFLSRCLPVLVLWINYIFFFLVYRRPRVNVDKSYKIMNFDCLFKQYVNEWSIPIEHTREALLELKQFIEREKDLRVHFPIEVRFVKRDDIWLSPCFGRDSCFIGIIMYRPYGYTIPYEKYFDGFSEIMKRFGGRPHWAKEFSLSSLELEKMYPKWNAFCELQKKLDPHGVFANPWLKRHTPSVDG